MSKEGKPFYYLLILTLLVIVGCSNKDAYKRTVDRDVPKFIKLLPSLPLDNNLLAFEILTKELEYISQNYDEYNYVAYSKQGTEGPKLNIFVPRSSVEHFIVLTATGLTASGPSSQKYYLEEVALKNTTSFVKIDSLKVPTWQVGQGLLQIQQNRIIYSDKTYIYNSSKEDKNNFPYN